MPASITLDTRINELGQHNLARLGQTTARKLAQALAGVTGKKSASDAAVEDLLNYLPMRYEDRSNLARISDLKDGMEASLELYVKRAGGYQVRNKRSFNKRLFIFEISATDRERSGREVVVWTFLSGPHAQQIITNYSHRFARGSRFVAFGKWEWDPRRHTFALRLNKPDEIEILPALGASPGSTAERQIDESATEEDSEGDPALAAIHVGRRVPVYRKLGELRPKQLREIMYRSLTVIHDHSIPETLPEELRKRQLL